MNAQIQIKHFNTTHTVNVRINENGAFAEDAETGRDYIYRGTQKSVQEVEKSVKDWMSQNWQSELSHYF